MVELRVVAIGTHSNRDHPCKKFAVLRKRINESPTRRPLSHEDNPKPRSKRFLTAQDIADIARRYGAGETTQQIGTRYGISKTRVGDVLREQNVTIRRQGLTDEQVTEAAKLYAAGSSLAWLGARYGASHTTVATALRHHGVQLRQRQAGSDLPVARRDWAAWSRSPTCERLPRRVAAACAL